MKAVVLGAGPSGLAAAEALLERGARVTVLEANARVGGLAKSHAIGNHWADIGPHRLHEQSNQRTRELLAGAGGLVERPRVGRIHLGQSAVDYPLSPLQTLLSLGPRRTAAFAWGALTARWLERDGSYESEAARRVGRAVYHALYSPAARKIWGRDPRDLDADQAQARVSSGGPLGLLKKLFGGGEPGHYLYPKAGANGRMYDAWAEALRARGVELVTGARVCNVAHEAGRVRGVSFERAGDLTRLDAERVVSTLALPRLVDLLDPTLSVPGRESLTLRSIVVLHAVLARPRLSKQDVHYFPEASVPFARLTEQAAFGRTSEAPHNETVITLDFYDDRGGPRTRMDGDQLLALAWPHLERLGIERGEVRQVKRVVCDDAYPVLCQGYREARARCLDVLASIEGLLSTGRGGLFLHVNQHHAIDMGLSAGAVALQSAGSSQRWREHATRFEACRVVD